MQRFTSLLIGLASFACCNTALGEDPAAYLIRIAPGGKVTVDAVTAESLPPPETRGLLVWTADDGDRWLPLTDDKWIDRLADMKTPMKRPATDGFSRGGTRGGGAEAAISGLTRTAPVDPRNITDKLRGGELVTPLPGSPPAVTFRSNPVVRRLAEDEGEKFPAIEGDLARSVAGGEWEAIGKVRFSAGSDRFALQDLKPGLLRLQFPARGKTLAVNLDFIVATPAQRAAVLGRADELAKVLGADDPLVRLFAVEALLGAKPRNGVPAYAGDILDVLEESADAKLSPYLLDLRERLRKQLTALSKGQATTEAAPATDPDATGLPAIDAARSALLAGRYKEAEAALAKSPDDPRSARLTKLYRAVLLTETGASDREAEIQFSQAVLESGDAAAGDRFRIHVNFALFLHRRAQDRLNTHAVLMAAGVNRTVSAVVGDWKAARDHYELAATFADARQAAGLGSDLARLYALLADVVRTLDPTDSAKGLAAAASAVSEMEAEACAKAANDPMARGLAREIHGNLALARGDVAACRSAAAEAMADFTASGFLAGVENAHQLLGRAALRANDSTAALRHLTASHLIAELLRDRLAEDRVGRTRAAFFARRAFVLDALVELHLQAGHPAEALAFAEQAKARAFTDLLAADGAGPARTAPARPLPDILRSWPKSTAAIEYFLGRKTVWAFVVTGGGEVRAFELKAADGKPADPRDLIEKVRHVVGGMDGYARKMAERLVNDSSFDNSWQDDLADLAKILLPAEALAELRKAEVVLLAPQHVLHYLPFAALVLEKDATATPKTLAKPKRFLVDEAFVTVNVPSITGWDALRHTKLAPVRRAANAVGLVQAPGEAKLEGVERDLANLKNRFGADLREVIAEEAATPGRAGELFTRRGLLLLATHGYNDADSPLESYLVLQPDAKSPEGRLRASDVYRRSVRADVVVMSACYTGLGDRSPLASDDLFGLQRAFLQAGARAVVAGLWDVYDLTAPELLDGFLSRLASGTPAARSAKEAQKEFLDKYRAADGIQPFVHPYFWAVYSVLGDDQAGVGKP
jgi:CHAT domain-containing protein